MDDAALDENRFNALYPFKSGNLPRTPEGAAFTRSVFFMESCREQMSFNWQQGGPHSTHMEWLNKYNSWRRQAIRAVENMERELEVPHRRAKRFICRKKDRNNGECVEPAIPPAMLREWQ